MNQEKYGLKVTVTRGANHAQYLKIEGTWSMGDRRDVARFRRAMSWLGTFVSWRSKVVDFQRRRNPQTARLMKKMADAPDKPVVQSRAPVSS